MTMGRLVIAIAAVLFLTAGTGPAAACDDPRLVGVWENPKARHKDVARVEIAQDCHILHKGTWAAQAETIWAIRVWSRCRPRDCAWGRALGRREDAGPLTATFETFSARRLVELEAHGNDLNLRYSIDFRSASQQDVSAVVRLTRID